jgi:hypothetical protein
VLAFGSAMAADARFACKSLAFDNHGFLVIALLVM